MEKSTQPPDNRLYVTCGIILRGSALEVDRLLSELPERGLECLRKKVEFGGKLWLVKADEKPQDAV